MPKIAEFIVGLVIFLFLFFGLFLFFFQKGNRLSKNLLGFFFLALGLAVADVFLLKNGTYAQFPQYAYFLNSLPLVYGPLLWFFTQSVVVKNFKLRKVDLIHFLPYALLFTSLIFVYHIQNIDFKREFMKRATDDPGPLAAAFSFLVYITIGIYIYYSHQRIKEYRNQIKEEVSNIEKINLGWLDFTLMGFVVFMILSLGVQTLVIFYPDYYGLNLMLLFLVFVMLIFIMGAIIKGLRSDVRFETSLEKSRNGPPNKRTLSNPELEILESLKSLMVKQTPFLDPSLTLKDLAKQMNIPSRDLSYLINHGEGKSFFDFINAYRIRFAQDEIVNSTDKGLTILEVMYSSGFNSKSSFNTAFKKHTGYTPTQWKKLNS